MGWIQHCSCSTWAWVRLTWSIGEGECCIFWSFHHHVHDHLFSQLWLWMCAGFGGTQSALVGRKPLCECQASSLIVHFLFYDVYVHFHHSLHLACLWEGGVIHWCDTSFSSGWLKAVAKYLFDGLVHSFWLDLSDVPHCCLSKPEHSRRRMLAATSMAPRLDVLGRPRHSNKAFLYTLSSRVVPLLHCQTVEPYSIIVLTRVL